jgi:predicted porin
MNLRETPVNRLTLFLCLIFLGFSNLKANATEIKTKVYGEINVAYEARDPADDDFKSHVSRIGVKGDLPLTESLEIIYQVEQEVDLVSGGLRAEDLFSMRNTLIGVSGNFGKLFFGTHDTPMKRSQGKADLFNDQAGDIKNILNGDVRAKESFFYHSPTFNQLQIQLAFVPSDENFDASSSASVTWSKNGLYLGFASDQKMRKNDKAVAKTKVYDTQRFSAVYKTGPWQMNAILQQSKRLNQIGAQRESGFSLGLGYAFNRYKLVAQTGRSDIIKSDGNFHNFGIERKLAENAKAYLYHSSVDKDGEENITSLGIEYKFK